MKNNNPVFNSHIDTIRAAKSHADQVLNIVNPGHNEAEASLALAWENLFDYFIDLKSEDAKNLTALNTVSSIIHKLTASSTQIKNLEIKSRELLMKEDDHQTKKEQLQKTLEDAKKDPLGISAETLANIEAQLNLL